MPFVGGGAVSIASVVENNFQQLHVMWLVNALFYVFIDSFSTFHRKIILFSLNSHGFEWKQTCHVDIFSLAIFKPLRQHQ